MELKAIKALTAAALLATATAASAGTAPFSMVSGVAATGVDVSLSVQQSTVTGYDYDFVVSNSSLMGIVTGVYFEMDWDSLLNGKGKSTGPAGLSAGSATPQIADWEGTKASHTVADREVRTRVGRFLRISYANNLLDGIQEGESQTFSFTTDTDTVSLLDLQSMIGTDGFGVAVRMQGLTSDEQAAAWGQADQREQEIMLVQRFAAVQEDLGGNGGNSPSNGDDSVQVTAAPSPTAALAGLVVAGIAGLRRRRK